MNERQGNQLQIVYKKQAKRKQEEDVQITLTLKSGGEKVGTQF